MNKLDFGVPFSASSTGTASATASQTGTGQIMYITDISGSSDKSGSTIQLKDGSTVKWQAQLIANTATGPAAYDHSFGTPIVATSGTVSVVTTGTNYSDANIAGTINSH